MNKRALIRLNIVCVRLRSKLVSEKNPSLILDKYEFDARLLLSAAKLLTPSFFAVIVKEIELARRGSGRKE